MLQSAGMPIAVVFSVRPLRRLSMITSQYLPNVLFQPGYFSSSQSRYSGPSPPDGFHHTALRHAQM